MKRTIITSLALLFISLAACKKEAQTVEDKLMAHGWILTSQFSDASGTNRDYFLDKAECERDHIYLFLEDGKFRIENGEIVCNGGDGPGETVEMNWQVSDDEKKLLNFYNHIWTIETLTADLLVITSFDSGGTYTWSYKRK